MKEYKLLVQRMGLVGLTRFITRFQGVILLPILTKNMSIGDYGIWAQIMVTINIIPPLMSMGLSETMARFMPSAKNTDKFQDMFFSFLSIILFTSIITSLAIYAMSEPIANLLFNGNQLIVEMLALIVFMESFQKFALGYYRAVQQVKKHFMLNVGKDVLLVILVSFFVLQGEGIVGCIKGLLLKSIIVTLIDLYHIVPHIGFKVPEFKGIKEHLAYGIPAESTIMSKWILNSSDRYVIGAFWGTSAVGYYAPGYTLGTILQMFVAPLNFMLPMVLSKHYDENNVLEVKKYMSYSLKYFLAISIPGVFGLSLLSRPLLEILSTPEIASQSYYITPFVALSTLFLGVFSVFEKVAMLMKKTKIIGIIWLLAAILNLVLNLLLIPSIGILAAAATTLFSFMAALAFMIYYSRISLKFDMNLSFIAKSFVSSFIMSGILVLWSPDNLSSIMLSIVVCSVAYVFTLIMLKGITKNEIEFFKMFLPNI